METLPLPNSYLSDPEGASAAKNQKMLDIGRYALGSGVHASLLRPLDEFQHHQYELDAQASQTTKSAIERRTSRFLYESLDTAS